MVYFGFSSFIGLLAFLSLIPLIILYLIRPKPKEVSVPSLMFFHEKTNKKTERGFFKRFSKDWLFWLQLLILTLLSLFFAQPYMVSSGIFLVDNVVLVVDASASTGVDGIFEDVIQKSKDLVGKSTTIVIVSTKPYIGIKEADKRTAVEYLNNMDLNYGESQIGDAMLLAEKYTSGGDAQIFVISDFKNTGGSDIESSRDAVAGRGIQVNFVDVGKNKRYSNIGIIDAKIGEETSQVSIKNFNEQTATFNIKTNDKQQEISVGAGSVEVVSFDNIPGINEANLEVTDDFAPDNTAYLSIPEQQYIDVLLLSDNPSSYIKAALTSSPYTKLDTENHVPDKKYDVYIVHSVENIDAKDRDKLLENVMAGAGLVVHAQDDMLNINYGELLPIEFGEKKGFAVAEEAQANRFTKDILFGGVDYYFSTKEDKGLPLVSAENSSLISLHMLGNGKLLYYGIPGNANDFELDPGYPIFWTRVVKYLGNVKSISDLNKKGGDLITFPKSTRVKTPTKTRNAQALYFDVGGVYDAEGELIAVNLFSEKESSLTSSGGGYSDNKGIDKEEKGVQQSLGDILLISALLFILLELIFIKVRGEV